MMQSSGEFRRYADEQVAENTVTQRRIQNALRDAAARIDALEKKVLELDAVCCEYQRQRDSLREQVQSITAERAHAVAALSEDADKFRAERDEARWMYCEAVILHGTAHRFGADGTPEPITEPQELAQTLGWDGLEGKR